MASSGCEFAGEVQVVALRAWQGARALHLANPTAIARLLGPLAHEYPGPQ